MVLLIAAGSSAEECAMNGCCWKEQEVRVASPTQWLWHACTCVFGEQFFYPGAANHSTVYIW